MHRSGSLGKIWNCIGSVCFFRADDREDHVDDYSLFYRPIVFMIGSE